MLLNKIDNNELQTIELTHDERNLIALACRDLLEKCARIDKRGDTNEYTEEIHELHKIRAKLFRMFV